MGGGPVVGARAVQGWAVGPRDPFGPLRTKSSKPKCNQTALTEYPGGPLNRIRAPTPLFFLSANK